MVVGVVGFPRRGKSTFLSRLYSDLRRRGQSFFVQRGCPDGEGQWTFETENGKSLRLKGEFTRDFVEWVIRSTRGLSERFERVYVDLGGRMSEENKRILREAGVDAVIVVGESVEEILEWVRFVKSVVEAEIFAILSKYDEEKGKMVFKPIVL